MKLFDNEFVKILIFSYLIPLIVFATLFLIYHIKNKIKKKTMEINNTNEIVDTGEGVHLDMRADTHAKYLLALHFMRISGLN